MKLGAIAFAASLSVPVIGSAADQSSCLASMQALDSVLGSVSALGLASHYNEVASNCGVNKAECENDEPGTAYYAFKATCILNKASLNLNNR